MRQERFSLAELVDFKDGEQFDFTLQIGLEEIEIVNPLGQLVAKFTLTPYLRYDLTDLPSGRYSVKIKTKSTLYFSKFIKE